MSSALPARPYDVIPEGRRSLAEFLAATEMTKNTFFLSYRHNPSYTALVDIQINAGRRMHMPRTAADVIARERRSAWNMLMATSALLPSARALRAAAPLIPATRGNTSP